MKTIVIIAIILIVFIVSIFVINYYTSGKQVACTEDAKICPDGTAVMRIPPDCEFEQCPEEDSNIINNECIEIGCGAQDVFAGSINSDKYYECRCGWAKTILPENLVCFKSDSEAVADGRIKSEC